MKAQKRMQEIQPRIEKIKEKHKGDQQSLWKQWQYGKMRKSVRLEAVCRYFYNSRADRLILRNSKRANPDNAFLLYANYTNLNLGNIDTNFLNILNLQK